MIISTAELEKYFGKEVTPAKMKEQIMSLLDDWKEKQPPELAKARKSRSLTSNNFETFCPEGPPSRRGSGGIYPPSPPVF